MGKIRTRNQYQAEFVKCIQKFGGKYQTWEIFADFISMFACAISNGIDSISNREKKCICKLFANTQMKNRQSFLR